MVGAVPFSLPMASLRCWNASFLKEIQCHWSIKMHFEAIGRDKVHSREAAIFLT